jgi:hypothetical protein
VCQLCGCLVSKRIGTAAARYAGALKTTGFGVLCALGLLDWWLFQTFLHTTYPHWYLKNGARIRVATSIVATPSGEINRCIGLISAQPMYYLSSCCIVPNLKSLKRFHPCSLIVESILYSKATLRVVSEVLPTTRVLARLRGHGCAVFGVQPYGQALQA